MKLGNKVSSMRFPSRKRERRSMPWCAATLVHGWFVRGLWPLSLRIQFWIGLRLLMHPSAAPPDERGEGGGVTLVCAPIGTALCTCVCECLTGCCGAGVLIVQHTLRHSSKWTAAAHAMDGQDSLTGTIHVPTVLLACAQTERSGHADIPHGPGAVLAGAVATGSTFASPSCGSWRACTGCR